MDIFNQERRNYYIAKKRELARKKQANQVINEDALFIYHYGMIAYLELFPEAKGFGVEWHREIVKELQIMEKRRLANLLSGIYKASLATKYKKANRTFIRIIKEMLIKR
jgi:hypothetical protein